MQRNFNWQRAWNTITDWLLWTWFCFMPVQVAVPRVGSVHVVTRVRLEKWGCGRVGVMQVMLLKHVRSLYMVLAPRSCYIAYIPCSLCVSRSIVRCSLPVTYHDRDSSLMSPCLGSGCLLCPLLVRPPCFPCSDCVSLVCCEVCLVSCISEWKQQKGIRFNPPAISNVKLRTPC